MARELDPIRFTEAEVREARAAAGEPWQAARLALLLSDIQTGRRDSVISRRLASGENVSLKGGSK